MRPAAGNNGKGTFRACSRDSFNLWGQSWKPRETDYRSGAIWKYAQLVGPARFGALTTPGADKETHCYADI